MSDTKFHSGGIRFFGLLTIVFIILKLLDIINWTWFWVLSPLIFSTGIGLFILAVVLILVWRNK